MHPYISHNWFLKSLNFVTDAAIIYFPSPYHINSHRLYTILVSSTRPYFSAGRLSIGDYKRPAEKYGLVHETNTIYAVTEKITNTEKFGDPKVLMPRVGLAGACNLQSISAPCRVSYRVWFTRLLVHHP